MKATLSFGWVNEVLLCKARFSNPKNIFSNIEYQIATGILNIQAVEYALGPTLNKLSPNQPKMNIFCYQ